MCKYSCSSFPTPHHKIISFRSCFVKCILNCKGLYLKNLQHCVADVVKMHLCYFRCNVKMQNIGVEFFPVPDLPCSLLLCGAPLAVTAFFLQQQSFPLGHPHVCSLQNGNRNDWKLCTTFAWSVVLNKTDVFADKSH